MNETKENKENKDNIKSSVILDKELLSAQSTSSDVDFAITWHKEEGIMETMEEFREHFESIKHLFKHYVFGWELGKSGETPHIQGCFKMKRKKGGANGYTFTGIKKLFSKKIHIENRKKPMLANLRYCKKEGLDILTNLDEEDNKIKEINENWELLDKTPYEDLWDYQKQLVDLFKNKCPYRDRTIHWVKGDCAGKSTLCEHLIDYQDALIVGGKDADILYGVANWIKNRGPNGLKILVVDIPKINSGGVSYQALEKIKNSFFYSGKYEGDMVRFNRPHILVMSNELPDTSAFVKDRWRIYTVEDRILKPFTTDRS
jgi:hypothetical protein